MQTKSTSQSRFFSFSALVRLSLYATTFSIVIGMLFAFIQIQSAAQLSNRKLTFGERVAYQNAIEEVYWRHRIWPKERRDPKPSLDAVMSEEQLEKKVADYLRNSQAVENYWQRSITAEQLQAEMDRMAQHTKQPEVLSELFEALSSDPFVIAECLARPALAESLVTSWYPYDQRIHGDLKQRAEAGLQAHPTIDQMNELSGKYREIELVKTDVNEAKPNHDAGHSVRLNSREWGETMQKLAGIFGDGPVAADPKALGAGQVATIAQVEAGVVSGLQEDESRYYALAVVNKTTDRLKLAMVSWPKERLESWLARVQNQVPADMSVASDSYRIPIISEVGGCIEDSWTDTSVTNAPSARYYHTAVWTGAEMIVWGGADSTSIFDTGGRYNPSIDTWVPTSTTNVPSARSSHTAVWTGTEMIVWGGENDVPPFYLNTGGRYNPGADSWTATSIVNAPDARFDHTVVWTGSEMIVWGGVGALDTGGRYNPSTDSWTTTSTTNAPVGRFAHTAVWTGNEMIVWGGFDGSDDVNTGGRYNPSTDAWAVTNTNNAPSERDRHTAVWTGSQMIVWGGENSGGDLNSGGAYNPSVNSWADTSTINAPEARYVHTAIWSGSEMVVWGGFAGSGYLNSGGKYNSDADTWTVTSTTNAPDGRYSHTAVWTGSQMLVWGGYGGDALDTGGIYCAASGPTPTASPTPTSTPTATATPTPIPRVTPRPHPTPHSRPTPHG